MTIVTEKITIESLQAKCDEELVGLKDAVENVKRTINPTLTDAEMIVYHLRRYLGANNDLVRELKHQRSLINKIRSKFTKK